MSVAVGKQEKRRVIKGIEHGVSGYTNYGCRCKTCTEANRDHSRQYRARRFAGNPLCVVPKCDRTQSHSYGNGLCYTHARVLLDLEDEDPKKAARIRKKLGIA